MVIEIKTIRLNPMGTPIATNTEDGQEYYQIFSGQGYAESGGNLERALGALKSAGVNHLLDVYVDSSGQINSKLTGVWLRKSDTDPSRKHVTI